MTTYRECSEGHEAIQIPEGMDCPKCEGVDGESPRRKVQGSMDEDATNQVHERTDSGADVGDEGTGRPSGDGLRDNEGDGGGFVPRQIAGTLDGDGIFGNARIITEVSEAVALTERGRVAANDFLGVLLECYERQGWRVMGYQSWREWATIEYDMSTSYAYRKLNQAKLIQDFSPIGEKLSISEHQARQISSPEAQEQVKIAIQEGADPQEAVKQATKSLPRKAAPNVTDPIEEYEESKRVAATPEPEPSEPPTEALEQNANTPTGNIYIDSSGKETSNEYTTGQNEKPKASHTYPPDFEGSIARLPGFVRREYPRMGDVESACREAGVAPLDLYERFCDFYRGSHTKYGWKDPGKAFFNNYHRTLAQIRRDQQPQQPPKDVCSHCGVGYVPGVGYMKFNLDAIKASGQFDHIPVSENGYYTNVPDDYLVEAQSADGDA